MHIKASFFTPIHYNNIPTESKSLAILSHERISEYFNYGNTQGLVIESNHERKIHKLVLTDKNENKLKKVLLTAVKVLSLMTVIIPLIMLALLRIYRGSYQFIITPSFQPGPQDNHILTPSFQSDSPNNNLPTVKDLMNNFSSAWKGLQDRGNDFDFNEHFYLAGFTSFLEAHAQMFNRSIDLNKNFGFIEKFDLDPTENPQVYVRADLHGDLKSLIDNISALQDEGLLDENYKCKPGVHLIFLGDYCDRGMNGTQILELLLMLRQESPQQIHLIRGNHEDVMINENFGYTDQRLMETIQNQEAKKALQKVYETMPLTVYLSLQGEKREYIQFTHGLFEPTFDPSPLLDQGNSGDYTLVPKKRELSNRVKTLAQCDNPLQKSARRICEIAEKSFFSVNEENYTLFNWADIKDNGTDSTLSGLASRGYVLNATDVQHYLNISTDLHRVALIFRGHQHKFAEAMIDERVVVSTLPVGIDCKAYNYNKHDRAYILTPQEKVEGWSKRIILRKRGEDTSIITQEQQPILNKDKA